MPPDGMNGNISMLKMIIVAIVVAGVTGLIVMYGTVRILESQNESMKITIVEIRNAQKDDGKVL
jgi:hypothetical protein